MSHERFEFVRDTIMRTRRGRIEFKYAHRFTTSVEILGLGRAGFGFSGTGNSKCRSERGYAWQHRASGRPLHRLRRSPSPALRAEEEPMRQTVPLICGRTDA